MVKLASFLQACFLNGNDMLSLSFCIKSRELSLFDDPIRYYAVTCCKEMLERQSPIRFCRTPEEVSVKLLIRISIFYCAGLRFCHSQFCYGEKKIASFRRYSLSLSVQKCREIACIPLMEVAKFILRQII